MELQRTRRRLLALVGLLLLGLDGFIGLELWLARNERLAAAAEEESALSRVLEEHVTRTLTAVDQVLTGVAEVAREQILRSPDGTLPPGSPELTDILRRRVGSVPLIRALTILSVDGHISHDSRAAPSLGLDVSDRHYFQAHLHTTQDRLFVGLPRISRVDNKWFIGVSRRISRWDGSFAGVVNAVVDPAYFEAFYASASAIHGNQTLLIHEQGDIVVAAPGGAALMGHRVGETGLFTSWPPPQAQMATMIRLPERGNWFVVSRQIQDLPLWVVMASSRDRVLKTWFEELMVEVLIMLAANAALVIFSYYFLRQVRREEENRRTLQESEVRAVSAQRQLVDAIESISEGFVLYDKNERMVMLNSRYREIMGPAGHLILPGMTYAEVLRAASDAGVVLGSADDPEAWIQERLNLHRTPGGPVEQQLSNGRWLLAWTFPTSDGGRVHIRTDITSLKEQQLELERQEMRLRTTVENINQGLSLFDPDGRLVICNRRWLDLLELPETFGQVGTPISEVMRWRAVRGDYGPGEVEEKVANRLDNLARHMDHIGERSLPGGRFVDVRSLSLRDGSRLATYTDITERKRAEQALVEKTAVLEGTLESMDQGILMLDARGIVSLSNRRFFAMFDLPLEPSLVGAPLEACLAALAGQGEFPEGGETPAHLAWFSFDGVDSAARRFEYVRSNGVVVEIYRRWVGGGGAILTFTDITERKRYEDALRTAKETAERTSEVKTLFLAKMSHELRTPFNAIIGFAEIIADKAFGSDSDAVEAYAGYAGEILSSGKHLLDLVNNILDVSKLESGRMAVDIDHIDLNKVLRSTATMMRELCRSRDVGLDLRLPVHGGDVQADERAVRQIITNLLSNAVKFTAAGGVITIGAHVNADLSFEITVADTGAGIPADQIDRILLPFEQGDNRYSRSAGGTGLGLALVKGLAELHEGTVTITSAVGEGTSVRVFFPAHSEGLLAGRE